MNRASSTNWGNSCHEDLSWAAELQDFTVNFRMPLHLTNPIVHFKFILCKILIKRQPGPCKQLLTVVEKTKYLDVVTKTLSLLQ